jgi:hypothetical protein
MSSDKNATQGISENGQPVELEEQIKNEGDAPIQSGILNLEWKLGKTTGISVDSLIRLGIL